MKSINENINSIISPSSEKGLGGVEISTSREHNGFQSNLSKFHYNPNLKNFARFNRNHATKAEACLWKYVLRASGLGFPFRRQRPVDQYIADFMCIPLRLIVEVDGNSHNNEQVAVNDRKRQERLEQLGFLVVRYTNNEVLGDIKGVSRHLKGVMEERVKNLPLTPSKGGQIFGNVKAGPRNHE
ncbi:MAG: endonuclease domain-containing protein [Cyclobacteriaceae bacterium]